MRPSAFANGNRIAIIETVIAIAHFNEAVGFRQRKCSALGQSRVGVVLTSMRPSAFANGNEHNRMDDDGAPADFNEAVGFRQRKFAHLLYYQCMIKNFNEAVGFRQRKYARMRHTQTIIANFNEAVGFRQRKSVDGSRLLADCRGTSMRPSAFANGNPELGTWTPQYPDYFNEAVGFRQRKYASRGACASSAAYFNEAVGFRQRKYR